MLEERYIVIKIEDLTDKDRYYIDDLLEERGIATVYGAVVIEHDWPEYKPTVEALKTRITLENLPPLPEGAMPWDDIDTYGPS